MTTSEKFVRDFLDAFPEHASPTALLECELGEVSWENAEAFFVDYIARGL